VHSTQENPPREPVTVAGTTARQIAKATGQLPYQRPETNSKTTFPRFFAFEVPSALQNDLLFRMIPAYSNVIPSGSFSLDKKWLHVYEGILG
jgi:hypothetical protein